MLNPKGMASGNGENVAGFLKRRNVGNGDTEITSEDGNYSQGRGGRGGEDASEERLSKAKEEVVQLANKVAEYREKGSLQDVALTRLLETLSKVQKEIIDLAGKDVPETLTRRCPVNGDKEIAAEDVSCSRREQGGGGGVGEEEDDSEESLSKVQKEAIEMAEKVADYREKGPVTFAQLLDKSLAQMRTSLPLMDTPANKEPTDTAEIEDGVASPSKEVTANVASLPKTSIPTTLLLERLAATSETLPKILRDIKSCKERLDKAIKSRGQIHAEYSPLVRVLKRKL